MAVTGYYPQSGSSPTNNAPTSSVIIMAVIIALSLLACCGCCGCGIYCYRRRKKRKERERQQDMEMKWLKGQNQKLGQENQQRRTAAWVNSQPSPTSLPPPAPAHQPHNAGNRRNLPYPTSSDASLPVDHYRNVVGPHPHDLGYYAPHSK